MDIIQNRELSWLSFNERVLQEAQDKTVPLMTRLRFLGIFSNNQDEFIKVRVANLIRLSRLKERKNRIMTGGYSANELLPLVNDQVLQLQDKFVTTYSEIVDEMAANNIFLVNEKQLSQEQTDFCRQYFQDVVSQRLVPLIIRKNTKLPFLPDGNIYHLVKMESEKSSKYAIIQIPVSSACSRFIVLPSKEGKKEIIFLDDIIRLCLNEIFFMFNYTRISAYTFKILRDAELTLDDDTLKSVIRKMEESIDNRMHGRPIRFIHDREMPDDMIQLMVKKLGLSSDVELESSGRYHLLKDLMKFPKMDNSLEDVSITPVMHPDLKPFSSLFNVIKHKDILVNYPYHSFNNFIDFLREAAIDPKVERIYITLYRTAERSKVINALVNAAKNGKQVTVLVELMARFDEDQNIETTSLLQRAGVKVIHGEEGLKVHCKLALVERREGYKYRGYVYVGTGNFNESTAKIYSDFGLFTTNDLVANDARAVFSFLQVNHLHFECKKLLVSPYYMRDRFEQLIEQEIKFAQKGKKAYIYAKFNSLTDEKMISLLYKASKAGVEIHLIIRGACCLRPGVKELSENIKVISIVDKYLEHARMVIFGNGGKEKVFILSADWMTRNLNRRVEVGIPISDRNICKTLSEVFDMQWNDNVKARSLGQNGVNSYVTNDKEPLRSQIELFSYYSRK